MHSIEVLKNNFMTYLASQVEVKDPVNLYEPIAYILDLGGKRLRPVLTLLACELYSGQVEKAYNAALAIEVFHNFTLIHDDIMDNANIRRGKPTVHVKWNQNAGILSGDAMLIMAYQCLEGYNANLFKNLTTLFSKTALEVCEGQQLDIDFETRLDVSIEDYIKMIKLKTSVLVAAALKMGALIAEAEAKQANLLYDFGLNLGIAFQLQDDYLDTFGDETTFGKKIGGDIIENKKTFLFLKAIEECNSLDKEKLIDLYSNCNIDPNTKVNEVIFIFNKYNIRQLVLNEINLYTHKAYEIVENLDLVANKKDILKNLGQSLIKRTN
jgi:geranylgeranyl diphosphate synthase type II